MVRVLRNNNMIYPVEIEKIEHEPLTGLYWLPPRSFLYAMAQHGDLSHILGGFRNLEDAKPVLTLFWNRYQKIHPQFELFGQIAAGRKRANQCIPIYIHGDEGVTYKKKRSTYCELAITIGVWFISTCTGSFIKLAASE